MPSIAIPYDLGPHTAHPHKELTIFQPTYPVRLAIKLDVPGSDAASLAEASPRCASSFRPCAWDRLGITVQGKVDQPISQSHRMSTSGMSVIRIILGLL